MIIEIPDDNSIVKWKYADNEDWKSAEISDLIKAYERPSDEVIIAHERIAYERGVADGYAEALEEMKDKERPQGKWLYACYPTLNKEVFCCSICDVAFPIRHHLVASIDPSNTELHAIQTDSRFNFCPCCGARMIKGDNK